MFKPPELANRIMKTIDELLESNQTDETTHRFRSQTANKNKWGKMFLLPKAHKLSSEEINRVETHSLKILNKTLPGHRAQELCESGGGRPGFSVHNTLYGFCGRKAVLNHA